MRKGVLTNMAETMEELAELFKSVKLRRTAFGGVKLEDVWRTLAQLQKEYRHVYDAEVCRLQILLADRESTIRALQQENAHLQARQKERGENDAG